MKNLFFDIFCLHVVVVTPANRKNHNIPVFPNRSSFGTLSSTVAFRGEIYQVKHSLKLGYETVRKLIIALQED